MCWSCFKNSLFIKLEQKEGMFESLSEELWKLVGDYITSPQTSTVQLDINSSNQCELKILWCKLFDWIGYYSNQDFLNKSYPGGCHEPRTCHWRKHSFLLSHFTSNLLWWILIGTEQDYALQIPSLFVGLCWFIAPWFDLPSRLYSIFHPWKLILVELTIFYKLQFVFYIKIDKQYLICLLVSSAHVNSHEYNSEVSAKRICNICIKTPYANFLYLCISRSSERCFLFGSVKVYNLDRGIGPIFFVFC